MFRSIREGKDFGTREWILYGTFLIILVVGAISASRYSAANADYICTRVVEDISDCSNGAWSTWQQVSTESDTQACVQTTVTERTYTGVRISSHTLSYLTLRTACDAGYAQALYGDSGGASGFHGGSVVTQSSACQIRQTAVTRAPITSGSCASTVQTVTTFDTAESDLGPVDSQTREISSVGELNAVFQGLSGARLSVQPTLVHSGDSTIVQWKSQGVSACSVTGTNGDTWTTLSGKETSGPIVNKTIYTLNCTKSDGTPLTQSASVDIIPSWQEN